MNKLNVLPYFSNKFNLKCIIKLNIEVPVPDFSIGFWNCSDSVVFFVFHIIELYQYTKKE